jgi:hypothetical protein
VAGYAALNAAVAFPLDTYWHSLYGIDVGLWAPFHVMIICGMALTGLGAVYMLASTAHLATRIQAAGSRRVAYGGMVVAFAAVLSLFMLLTIDGLDDDKLINTGSAAISFYPFLIGLLVSCLLVASASLLPWKWGATSVIGVSVLLVIIDQLAIPPALTLLMQIEQLTFLGIKQNTPPQIAVVAAVWPLLTIAAGPLLDLVLQRAKKWGTRQLLLRLALATGVCMIPCMAEAPGALLILWQSMGVVGAILTFALGFLGIFIGIKLGQSIDETLHAFEG